MRGRWRRALSRESERPQQRGGHAVTIYLPKKFRPEDSTDKDKAGTKTAGKPARVKPTVSKQAKATAAKATPKIQ